MGFDIKINTLALAMLFNHDHSDLAMLLVALTIMANLNLVRSHLFVIRPQKLRIGVQTSVSTSQAKGPCQVSNDKIHRFLPNPYNGSCGHYSHNSHSRLVPLRLSMADSLAKVNGDMRPRDYTVSR